MIKTYNNFLNEGKNELPTGLPKEVSESCLIIIKSMYERVRNISFFQEDDDFFIRFQITEMDFKYIDPNEVLPLELSDKSMIKRNYYVELSYEDEFLSTFEVVYKIFFENMSNNHYKSTSKNDDFIDEYEEEEKIKRLEDSDIELDDIEFDDF